MSKIKIYTWNISSYTLCPLEVNKYWRKCCAFTEFKLALGIDFLDLVMILLIEIDNVKNNNTGT